MAAATGAADRKKGVSISGLIHRLLKQVERLSDPVRVFGLLTSERFMLMAVGLVRSKLAAIFLGPEGVGVVAQALALQDLLRQTMTLGVGGGFLKMIADAHGTKNVLKLNQVVTIVCGSIASLSLLAGIGVLLAPEWVSLQVFGRREYSEYALVTAFSAICLVNGGVLLMLLQGFQEWRSLTILNLLQGLVSVLISALLMPSMGVSGAIYSFAIAYSLSWTVSLVWVRRRLRDRHNWRYRPARPERSVVIELVQYAGIFSGSYIAASMITLLTRRQLIEVCGESFNGQYQVAWVASTTFLGAFGALVWNYGMPKIASLQSQEEISRSQNQLATLMLTLATPLVAGLIVTKELWIPLLFSRQFLPAGELVTLQLLAGWLELLRHSMNVTILPQKRFALYFVQFGFFSLMQLLGGYVLISFVGPSGIPLAMAIAGAFALIPIYYYHVRLAGFVPEARTLRMALGALLALVSVLLADQLTGFTGLRVLLWCLAAVGLCGVFMGSSLLGPIRTLMFKRI